MIENLFTGSFFFCQDHSFSAAATAATLAHEMGHNFGLYHDEDSKY